MSSWLSEREQRLVAGAETDSADTPIPTQIVSNGEHLPPPQSEIQRRVERRTLELADENGKRLGLDRRKFLRTSCGMAAASLDSSSSTSRPISCATTLTTRSYWASANSRPNIGTRR